MDKKILPLGNKALIKEDDPEKISKGGIHIPPTAKDGKYSVTATVVAVGRGKFLKDGTLMEPEIKSGDRIVLAKHHGSIVQYNNEDHRIVDMDVIEGVIEDE